MAKHKESITNVKCMKIKTDILVHRTVVARSNIHVALH